jgi:hypothetical protein
MPFKKAKTLSCWECKTTKGEGEMASWGAKGWRCNNCYAAELSYLREARKADVAMRKAAQDHFYNRFKEGNTLREFSLNFKQWSWPLFWDMVEEVRREDALLKEATTRRRRTPSPPPPIEEEYVPWEEEEAITYLESLPPLEKVKWSEVEF